MILLDTSGLLAAIDSAQRSHGEAAESLACAGPPLILSPFVLADLDYLLASRIGEAARMSLLAEVERGAYELEPLTAGDVSAARQTIAQHADLEISLADASISVLAVRHETNEVLTLDERHFRVLAAGGRPFRLLPADA